MEENDQHEQLRLKNKVKQLYKMYTTLEKNYQKTQTTNSELKMLRKRNKEMQKQLMDNNDELLNLHMKTMDQS